MDHNVINAINADAAHWRAKWDMSLRWAMGLSAFGRMMTDAGVLILRRWTGSKYPIPDDAAGVGFKLRPATVVSSDASASYSNNTTYYHLVDKVSPGGLLAPRTPLAVRPAVWGAAGHVGLLPNTPANVLARQNQAAKAVVTWWYNPTGQPAEPATFEIYANSGPSTMDLVTPVGSVAYVVGQRQYAWLSAAHPDGTLAHYTVRAKTAGGIESFIPRAGDVGNAAPLPAYSAMTVGDAASVRIAATAPAKPDAPTFA